MDTSRIGVSIFISPPAHDECRNFVLDGKRKSGWKEDLGVGEAALQDFPDLCLSAFAGNRLDDAHGDTVFRQPPLPDGDIAGDVDKPAALGAAASAFDAGDTDDAQEFPAAVGDP